jgi:hypothetical protein
MVRESESKDTDLGSQKILSLRPKGFTSQCTCAHFSGGTTIAPLLNLNLMSLGCQRHSSVPLIVWGAIRYRQWAPSHQTARLALFRTRRPGESRRIQAHRVDKAGDAIMFEIRTW